MDELDISGKRYISSKRAAKENRYHTDYIGQLIRSGKIAGSKVGRTWYVEVESLARYLEQPYQIPAPLHEPEVYVPKTFEPKEATAPHTLYASHETREVRHTSPADSHGYTGRTADAPARTGTLRYVEDDEPLLPQLGGKEHKIPVRVQEQPAAASPIAQTQGNHRMRQSLPPPRRTPKMWLYAAAVVGVAAFLGAVSLSYFLQADTTVGPASMSSSLHF
jgi:hypothetical protein